MATLETTAKDTSLLDGGDFNSDDADNDNYGSTRLATELTGSSSSVADPDQAESRERPALYNLSFLKKGSALDQAGLKQPIFCGCCCPGKRVGVRPSSDYTGKFFYRELSTATQFVRCRFTKSAKTHGR